MKKILSILCTLALVLGVVLIPGMFSISAETTYLTPVHTDSDTVHTVGNETCYGDAAGTAYNDKRMVFDYELNADKYYAITMQYKGTHNSGVYLFAHSDTTSLQDGGTIRSLGKALTLKNDSSNWTTTGRVFKGSDLMVDAGDKYLGINVFAHNQVRYIKNIEIREISTTADATTGAIDPVVTKGTFVPNSNGYMHEGWAGAGWLTFNYNIEADKYYAVSFIKTGNTGAEGDSYSKFFNLTTTSDLASATEPTYKYKLDAVRRDSNNGTHTVISTFKGSDIISSTGANNYFTIYAQKPGAVATIRDFRILEIPDNEYEKIISTGSASFNGGIRPQLMVDGSDVAYGWTHSKTALGGWTDWWCWDQCVVFDKVLEAGKTYTLTFQFKGHKNEVEFRLASFIKGDASNGSYGCVYADNSKRDIMPMSTNGYTTVTVEFEADTFIGSQTSDVYMGLKLHAYRYDDENRQALFKNFKLTVKGEEGTSSGGTSSGSTGSEGTGSGGTSSGGSGEGTTPTGVVRDPEFIYPTKLLGSATEGSDDKKVQKWDKLDVGKDITYAGGTFRPTYGWADGANTGTLVFDETLEAGAEYVLEFDRYSNQSADDIIKIGTAAADGTADFTKSVTVNSGKANEWSVYWHNGVSFTTDEVTNGTNNRLAISIQSGANGCLLKNFRLAKVTRDNTAYLYPSSIGKDMGAIAENGNIAYSVTTYSYDRAWLAFDYELKTDATYIIEFDYYGHNLIANWMGSGYAWRFGAASSADIDAGTVSDTFNTDYVDVNVPTNGGTAEYNGLNSKTYNHVARLVKGSDIVTDTNKYLVIYSKFFDCVPFLKNFKITEFSVKEPYMTPSNIAGSTEVNTEDNGDVSFGMYNSTLPERNGTLTFDYELDPDKTYILKFEGIAHGEWKVPIGVGVTSGKDKADIATAKPYAEGSDVTKIQFPKNVKNWLPAGFMFKGSDLITGDKKTFAIKLNIYWGGEEGDPTTYQPTMVKNITLEEFTGDGYMHPVKYNSATSVTLDGDDIAYMNYYYGVNYLAYDFEVKADKEYLITYDIKGCNTGLGAGQFGWSATAVADPYAVNYSGNSENHVIPDVYVPLNSPNAKDGKYVSHSVTVSGADMGANETNKYFTMVKFGIEQHTYIKNFKILEKPEVDAGSVLLNGNFDDPNIATEFWNDVNGVKSYATNEAHNGAASMHIAAGDFVPVSQKADLLANTNYELSFWYKGKVGGQAVVGLSRDVLEISKKYGFAYGVTPTDTVDDWTKYTLTFNTGNYTNIYIAFIAGPTSSYYVDEVKLSTTNGAATWNANNTLVEPSILTNANYSPIDHTEFNELTTYKNWKAAEGKNMTPDATFDSKDASAWGDFITASNGVLSIAAGEGLDGSNALKFSAVKQEENTTAYYYIDVEPETSYFLTLWSRTPYWSQDNIAEMRYGIANVFEGGQFYVYREETRGYRLPCNDNEWHRTTIPFYSGQNTRVAFSVTGNNTTTFIDNLEIFKVADRVDDRSELSKVTDLNSDLHPYVTDTAPTKIYVGATKNLVRNSTFENADSKFWQKAQGYRSGGDNEKHNGKYITVLDWNGVAEIKDTGTTRGKALYYESNTGITGYPLGTSYIKYFDVEPNTEYTFVMDYIIFKDYQNPGVMGIDAEYKSADFGIAGASSLDLSVIKSINISDAYNPSLVWQDMAISFNTNGYKQVAFYIRDLGGAAYFDNISLFKSADGSETPVYEPEPPEEDDTTSSTPDGGESSTPSGGTSSEGTGSEGTGSGGTSSGGTSSGGSTPVLPPVFIQGEIKSNEYDVRGETGKKVIYDIAPGTTVKEVLDTLENNAGIKAFDAAGNEITDTSVPVGTNFTFRYMDGFSAVDAATVLIRGDINNDGYIDSKDMRLMMRSIVNAISESLTDEQMVVGDIDGDKEITPDDIAALSLHAGGSKLLEPIKYVSTEE